MRVRALLLALACAVAAVHAPATAWAAPKSHTRPLVRVARKSTPTPTLSSSVAGVVARAEFAHAVVGVEFYDLDARRPIFSLNPKALFTAASTTKLVTEGAALHALGPAYRFHTRVYRTGEIDAAGTLAGSLVVEPSGDPDLSGRALPNGTYAFENEDHSYGGDPVAGDPMTAVDDLATQIAAHGIKSITGTVIVQPMLFKEGDTETGTGTSISPVALNDNIVDLLIGPGASIGAAATVVAWPATSYLKIVDRAVTGPANSANTIDTSGDAADADGTHTLTIVGSAPLSSKPQWNTYAVADPIRFLDAALTDALRAKGIAVLEGADPATGGSSYAVFSAATVFDPSEIVADHVSLPFAQDVRLTLKVSQNLHAAMMPYLLGALVAHDSTDPLKAGFGVERDWLAAQGLDLRGASAADGEGGDAHFSPDFMVRYLAMERGQPEFWALHAGLPILGRDGTLAEIQTRSPAAGHVAAKTGTWSNTDYLNGKQIVSKGLAGYFTSASGRHVAFAVYFNNLELTTDADASTFAGQACGEIAALGYRYIR
jgi:PBP4 family serine-type D-alanyl-D-alanine carboxypeptidase